MKGQGEKLIRKHEQAVAALLVEPTMAAAAARYGVGQTTLRRWLQAPTFNDAYRSARRTVVDGTVAALQQPAGDAVACQRRNLTCGQAGVEVRAATAILEQVLSTADRADLEARLRRLEALPETQGAGDRDMSASGRG
jgi:hypothetical protein